MKCTLCNTVNENPEVIGDFVYGGKTNQKFYKCSNCEVAYSYPTISEEEEIELYSKDFEKFMEKRSGKDFDWTGPEEHIRSNEKQYKRRLKFFDEFLLSGKRVLEIGCSSGYMLLPLKEKGLNVVGIEPSNKFSAFLTSKSIPVYNSMESLSNSSNTHNKFDLVMHFFVLEHIRNPIDFLSKALDFVDEGGRMVFEVPSRSDPLISIYNIPAFQLFYLLLHPIR